MEEMFGVLCVVASPYLPLVLLTVIFMLRLPLWEIEVKVVNRRATFATPSELHKDQLVEALLEYLGSRL